MTRLSFLLLHEVPDDTKRKVIDRIMLSVPVGGKAIFTTGSSNHSLSPCGTTRSQNSETRNSSRSSSGERSCASWVSTRNSSE